MFETQFAAVGVFVTVAAVVFLIGIVAIVLVDSIKNWLRSRNEIVKNVARVMEVQTALMKTNNDLNERVKVLEEELMSTRSKCHGLSSAIRQSREIDYGKDEPKEDDDD